MEKIEVKICCGINCSIRGGQELLDAIENDAFLQNNCEVHYNKCLKGCEDNGNGSPVVEINGILHKKMTPERLLDLISKLVK